MKKRDLILILALILIAAVSYGAMQFASKKGDQVVVTVNKKVVLEESLDQNKMITIPLTHGENKIQIKDREVSMTEADCPDQICVKHKAISKSGETIVCLPHKVVISIESKDSSDIDMIAK